MDIICKPEINSLLKQLLYGVFFGKIRDKSVSLQIK